MRLCHVFIALIMILSFSFPLSATTWHVSPTGCSDSTCDPCCTIQAAVEESGPGDTISIGPGTYPEEIVPQNMNPLGDLTLVAAGGPGTVLVNPGTGRGLITSIFPGTLTVEGIDFSAATSSGIYVDQTGPVILLDVTANDCGYTAFVIDATGPVTMERCTADRSGRTGIQLDGPSTATLTDCAANDNVETGILVSNMIGPVDLINPTTTGNTLEGIDFQTAGANTVSGATVTDNDRAGLSAEISGSISVSNSVITGNATQGIDVNWDGADLAESATLVNTTISNNGHSNSDSGVRIRNLSGPIVITNCTVNNNGWDGVSPETSVTGSIEITGGEADGNIDDGFDLRVNGDVTIVGARADTNGDSGFAVDCPGILHVENCIANGNQNGSGFALFWQDPDRIDEVTVIDCTANSNGLADGGNGIIINHVTGPVLVSGTVTNANDRTGLRIDDTIGSVLIKDAVSNAGLEEGFKVDVDVGPLIVIDSNAEDNALNGLVVNRQNVDIESVWIRRNVFQNNGTTAVEFTGLGGGGPFIARCNDIVGNSTGMTLSNAVTVDARWIWWGDITGPSGEGPGAGDTIWFDAGGEILFDPWLQQSFSSQLSVCEFFSSGFEAGSFGEWDVYSE
ncbi:MAG: right-handed parallel beta-helix repeat-containing protein [Acidobacteriota bacterium]